MKTWKLLVIILVVALLVGYYIFGTGYLKLRRQNEAFASQITDTREALARIPLTPADLEQRLAEARADLAAAESSFAGETDDTRILNDILRLAEETGVRAIPLSTQPWTIANILGHDYSVFRVTMEVTGDFSRLQEFVNRLESGDPHTLVIEYLTVDRGSAGHGEDPQVKADVEIAVYAPAPAAD